MERHVKCHVMQGLYVQFFSGQN